MTLLYQSVSQYIVRYIQNDLFQSEEILIMRPLYYNDEPYAMQEMRPYKPRDISCRHVHRQASGYDCGRTSEIDKRARPHQSLRKESAILIEVDFRSAFY